MDASSFSTVCVVGLFFELLTNTPRWNNREHEPMSVSHSSYSKGAIDVSWTDGGGVDGGASSSRL